MNIRKYIQQEFGSILDKHHNKNLVMITTDFWEEASRGMFIPQKTGGHELMRIRIYLKNETDHLERFTARDIILKVHNIIRDEVERSIISNNGKCA